MENLYGSIASGWGSPIPPVPSAAGRAALGRAPGSGPSTLRNVAGWNVPRRLPVIGYVDDATLVGPKAMQGEKQILKGHWLRSPDQYIGGASPYTSAVGIVN